LLTDVDGVKNKNGEIITKLSIQDVKTLIDDGTIIKGMIPKTETAIKALEDGVRAAVILDGRTPNACLLELFTDHGAGTLIRKQ
jgi:acetylglutamate kinase